MKIIEPSIEILTEINGDDILKLLEIVGRTCYKSEDRITEDSAGKFCSKIIKNGHEAVIEHFNISVRFICDRGVSHEIVRHRIASYAQESTRYVNYSQKRFPEGISFIKPVFWEEGSPEFLAWEECCEEAEVRYNKLIRNGASPQEARSILPTSLKTELVMTANLREWRHFLKLRTAQASHPQMREVAILLLKELKSKIPVVFDDI